MIRCGMSEVNITPALGSSIPGQLKDRKSTGIKDDLFAKALVLENEGETVAFVVVDASELKRDMVEGIRERAHAITGIPSRNIMVSATHTHTGGPVKDGFEGMKDDKYIQTMILKAADAVNLAYLRRREARIGFGRGREEDIAFNRRHYMKDGTVRTNPGVQNPLIDRPAGPVDPEVPVMRIDDANGHPIGVVSNFSCHTDTVGGTEYSADYPGQLSRTLKQVLGPQVVSLFFLGACGDINHIDTRGKREIVGGSYSDVMGTILAGEIIKVREKITTSNNIKLGIGSRSFSVELRRPTAAEITAAREYRERTDVRPMDYAMAGQILKLAEDKERIREVEVQVARIGELAVVGLPGEPFVEFGHQIKTSSPFPFTIVNELCNAAGGYICSREAYRQGGYETRPTMSCQLPEDTGEHLVRYSLQLLNELHGN